MLKIRLMRIGAKKKPFYRVVAVDERSKRPGGYLEILSQYTPLTESKDIKLKQDRIDHWIKQGAQMTNGFLRIIGKAKQRLPQKAKKPARNASHSDAGGLKKEAPVSPAAPKEPTPESTTAESTPIETTPITNTTKTENAEEAVKPVVEAEVKDLPEEKTNEGSA